MAHSSAAYQRGWYQQKKQSDPGWYAKREAKRQEWLRSPKGRDCIRKQNTSDKARLNGLKRGAAQRNLEWRLSDEEAYVYIRSACHYCGKPPVNGIDRKDNDAGYFADNCVPCCAQCNRSKHTQSYSEFGAYLDRLVAFRSKLTK